MIKSKLSRERDEWIAKRSRLSSREYAEICADLTPPTSDAYEPTRSEIEAEAERRLLCAAFTAGWEAAKKDMS